MIKILALALTLALPRSAGTGPCDSVATDKALNACLTQRAAELDSILKAAESRARDQFFSSAEQRAKFDAAAKDWRRYRRSQCEAAASVYAGGNVAQVIELNCWIALTQERIAEVRSYAVNRPSTQ